MSLTREEVVWWYTPTLRKDREEFRRWLEVGPCHTDDRQSLTKLVYADQWGGFWSEFNRPGQVSREILSQGEKHKLELRHLSPVGELPVLLYSEGGWRLEQLRLLDSVNLFQIDKGWRFSRAYLNDRENWEGGLLRGGFTGPDDPTLTTLDRVLWVLNDPRTVDLESIPETDDTVRVVRLIQTVFQRFVVDEVPTVPSLWREGDQVLCGWNELHPEDGRELQGVDRQKLSGRPLRDTTWGDGAAFEHPETWRWLVP